MAGDTDRMTDKPIALETRDTLGARLFSPSVSRNKDVICDAFGEMAGTSGRVLEIGSGTGEHGARLCTAFEGLEWHPSDPDPASRVSISAWADTISDGRMKPPLDLRADQPKWWDGLARPEIVVSINMIHIAPREAMGGLITGAGALLARGGKLFLYGPFLRDGETAQSNLDFDQSLKSRDPRWGVRDLDKEVAPLAAQHGLQLSQVRPMPANNLSVVFDKG